MGRIRSIKPEFPQSESMGRISREARLTFVLLWTIADDSGRARESSRLLASLLYPYDDDAPGLISGWLNELESEGCLTRYSVGHGGQGGKEDHYLQINNWSKHQRIDKPSESKIPAFVEPSRGVAEPSTKPREPSTTDQDMEVDMEVDMERKGKGKDPEGMQGGGSAAPPRPHRPPTLPAAPPGGPPDPGNNGSSDNSLPGLNASAFAEWDCERRRRGGKSRSSWTDAAKAKAAKLLAHESPDDQQAMVDASIANGWQGLIVPSGKPKPIAKFLPGEYMLDKVRQRYDQKD